MDFARSGWPEDPQSWSKFAGLSIRPWSRKMAHCEHGRVRSTCSLCSSASVFHQYEYKAKQRGLSFGLTLDEFERVISQPCFYCNEDREPRGLDRIDNRLGYYPLNVVPACTECNFMKRVMLSHRFINRATKIAQHQGKDVITALRRQIREQQALIAALLLNQLFAAPPQQQAA
jgi:hypothetical protein